jgi:hypothetical protein
MRSASTVATAPKRSELATAVDASVRPTSVDGRSSERIVPSSVAPPGGATARANSASERQRDQGARGRDGRERDPAAAGPRRRRRPGDAARQPRLRPQVRQGQEQDQRQLQQGQRAGAAEVEGARDAPVHLDLERREDGRGRQTRITPKEVKQNRNTSAAAATMAGAAVGRVMRHAAATATRPARPRPPAAAAPRPRGDRRRSGRRCRRCRTRAPGSPPPTSRAGRRRAGRAGRPRRARPSPPPATAARTARRRGPATAAAAAGPGATAPRRPAHRGAARRSSRRPACSVVRPTRPQMAGSTRVRAAAASRVRHASAASGSSTPSARAAVAKAPRAWARGGRARSQATAGWDGWGLTGRRPGP